MTQLTCPTENEATRQPDRRSLLLNIIESFEKLRNPDSNSCPSSNIDTAKDVIVKLTSIASSSDFCLSNNEDKHSKGRRKRGVNLTSNHGHNPRSNAQAQQVQQSYSENRQQTSQLDVQQSSHTPSLQNDSKTNDKASFNKFNGRCHYCKKYGHKEFECRRKSRDFTRPVTNSSESTGLDTFQAAPLCTASTNVVPLLEMSSDSITAQIDGLSSSSTIQRGAIIALDACELFPPSDLTNELVHDTAAIELFTGKLGTDEESQLQQPLLPASHPVLIARTTTSDICEEDWYSSPTSTLLACMSTATDSQLSSEIQHVQPSQPNS